MRSAPAALRHALPVLALLAGVAAAPARAAAATEPEVLKILQTVDDRQASPGDFRLHLHIEYKAEEGSVDSTTEGYAYRRDEFGQQMILFVAPKEHEGKGYLRMNRNLWYYDPNIGRWERRTERTRIGNTDARRSDLDAWKTVELYTHAGEGEEKVGPYLTQKIALTVKAGHEGEVAYPMSRLWVDANNNVLKRQDFVLSGKLARTSYFPRYKKVFSPSKKAEVWYAEEMRIYDELERKSSTLMLVKAVDLQPLEPNTFTKAWLESKSR